MARGGPQSDPGAQPSDAPAGDRAAQHYAAIVESSDDAILSKDLNGVILSWNQGAERLFGYSAAEAVGQPATLIIPADRHSEELEILDKIRRGERIRQAEAVRQRKDGSLVGISLTISPMRDHQGRVVGASTIARDITEFNRARERQQLLLREMNHRVKNLFALSSGIVGLSARSATSVEELVDSARQRLAALARAHALTFAHGADQPPQATTLMSLIRTIVAPFDETVGPQGARITVSGADPAVSGGAVTSLALLLHEFATNAAKYGALSSPEGAVEVVCTEEGDAIAIAWTERGGPAVVAPAGSEGFGGVLSRMAVTGQLGGEIVRDWRPEGLAIRLTLPLSRLAAG